MAYMICRHIKPSGNKCDAPAMRGMPYCYFHMKLHRRLHQSASVAESTAAESDAALDLPAMEDVTAVRLALTQVIQDLGAKRLDFRRAGRLLYGIQIASQLLANPKYEYKLDSVQNVTTSGDGEELGPAEYECDHEDCNKCPFATKDQCTRWHYVDKKNNENPEAVDDEDDDDDDEDDEDDDQDESDDNDECPPDSPPPANPASSA
jgi:hypothetical protein